MISLFNANNLLNKGLGYIAFVPFAYESLIETSFPQPEGLVLALPLVVAQIFSYILNLLTTMGGKFLSHNIVN